MLKCYRKSNLQHSKVLVQSKIQFINYVQLQFRPVAALSHSCNKPRIQAQTMSRGFNKRAITLFRKQLIRLNERQTKQLKYYQPRCGEFKTTGKTEHDKASQNMTGHRAPRTTDHLTKTKGKHRGLHRMLSAVHQWRIGRGKFQINLGEFPGQPLPPCFRSSRGILLCPAQCATGAQPVVQSAV